MNFNAALLAPTEAAPMVAPRSIPHPPTIIGGTPTLPHRASSGQRISKSDHQYIHRNAGLVQPMLLPPSAQPMPPWQHDMDISETLQQAGMLNVERASVTARTSARPHTAEPTTRHLESFARPTAAPRAVASASAKSRLPPRMASTTESSTWPSQLVLSGTQLTKSAAPPSVIGLGFEPRPEKPGLERALAAGLSPLDMPMLWPSFAESGAESAITESRMFSSIETYACSPLAAALAMPFSALHQRSEESGPLLAFSGTSSGIGVRRASNGLGLRGIEDEERQQQMYTPFQPTVWGYATSDVHSSRQLTALARVSATNRASLVAAKRRQQQQQQQWQQCIAPTPSSASLRPPSASSLTREAAPVLEAKGKLAADTDGSSSFAGAPQPAGTVSHPVRGDLQGYSATPPQLDAAWPLETTAQGGAHGGSSSNLLDNLGCCSALSTTSSTWGARSPRPATAPGGHRARDSVSAILLESTLVSMPAPLGYKDPLQSRPSTSPAKPTSASALPPAPPHQTPATSMSLLSSSSRTPPTHRPSSSMRAERGQQPPPASDLSAGERHGMEAAAAGASERHVAAGAWWLGRGANFGGALGLGRDLPARWGPRHMGNIGTLAKRRPLTATAAPAGTAAVSHLKEQRRATSATAIRLPFADRSGR